LGTFLGVSRQGQQGEFTPQKYVRCLQFTKIYKKSMSQTFSLFSKISTKKIDVSFSSTFFVLSRFRVFLGVQKHYQKRCTKENRVENNLQKIRPKIQN
jgi:hypothetical protein